MSYKEIYVLGLGKTTPVLMELALDCGYLISGLYHYNNDLTGQMFHSYNVLGSFDDLFNTDIRGKNFLLTMGDVHIRKELTELIESKGGIIPTLIHPTAIISRFCEISDKGVLIAPACIVQADVKIEKGVVMRDNALVCHTSHVGPFVFIGPKTLVGALIDVQELAYIGQKALLISGKATSIGSNSIIGAGSVVTKSVDDNTTVIGNPAKPIEK